MKPFLLKMVSFGPYLNETIDFKKIENKGIFLITGETGSGKTTIFDAISVALFGESNGDERTAESFKSDFDHQDEVMKIEFSFELKGRTFRVCRVPRQRRKKLRGEGYTEELGEATLYETISGEEVALDFSREVNAKIQELLGINARQFRQIVMIPQGQFRKLITESSEEREKILKSIFNVQKYEFFQKRLALQSKELETTLKDQKNLILSEIKHIKTEEGTPLNLLMQVEHIQVGRIIEETLQQIAGDSLFLQEIEQNSLTHKERITLCDKQIETVKKDNSLIDAFIEAEQEKITLEQLKDYHQELSNKVEQAEKAFRIQPLEEHVLLREQELGSQKQDLEEKVKECEALEKSVQLNTEKYLQMGSPVILEELKSKKEQVMFLKAQLPKVEGYENLKKKLNEHTLKYREEELSIVEINKMLITQGEKYQFMLEEKEKLSTHTLNVERYQSQLLELSNRLDLINQLDKCCTSYIGAIEQYKKSLQAFKKIEQEKKEQDHQYEIEQKLWLEGQAGILAQNLKEGDPCPVCGNLHPLKLARLDHTVPSKESLEEFKTNQLRLEKAFNTHQITLAADDQNRLNRKEQLKELTDKVSEIFEVNLTFDKEPIITFCQNNSQSLTAQIAQTKQALEHSKNENSRLETLKVQMETLSKKVLDLQQELQGLQQQHLKTIENKTIYESELIALEKETPEGLRDKTSLIEHIQDLENTIMGIENSIEQFKLVLEEVKKNHVIVTTTLSEARKSLVEKGSAYKKALDEFQKALQVNGFEDKEHYIALKQSQIEIQEQKKEVNLYTQKVHTNFQNLFKLSAEVQGLVKQDLFQLQEEKATLEYEQEMLTKEHTVIHLRIEDNKDQVHKIETIHKQMGQLLEQHALVSDLSQVANGSSSGSSKITFERYILAAFLQEIVDAANVRFHKMSNSRYELMRKNGSDRRKHTGLDLEVFDYYTGKARDINTLSGGEGFKASLALALGLADTAGAYAGGISLDTMFVDEGFGSLSAESLDHAINCLMDLKESGRLVGIISHVQELKERIDTQLIVEKRKTGSTTYFEGI